MAVADGRTEYLRQNIVRVGLMVVWVCVGLYMVVVAGLFAVCSQKLKFLWPIVTFFELSEYTQF